MSIKALPAEILWNIFLYVDVRTRREVSRVCRRWSDVCYIFTTRLRIRDPVFEDPITDGTYLTYERNRIRELILDHRICASRCRVFLGPYTNLTRLTLAPQSEFNFAIAFPETTRKRLVYLTLDAAHMVWKRGEKLAFLHELTVNLSGKFKPESFIFFVKRAGIQRLRVRSNSTEIIETMENMLLELAIKRKFSLLGLHHPWGFSDWYSSYSKELGVAPGVIEVSGVGKREEDDRQVIRVPWNHQKIRLY